ncbi:hypothetical protein NIES22_62390 [Calothrix brevissima NIES-22]|nr:hypothetical protein NIES22_62390 [Calothrix brevissima NIES-22]
MKSSIFDKLILFLQNLEQQKISHTIMHNRDESIMVAVAVPGERWEIEFLNNGSIEIEKFISNGDIQGEEAIDELFTRYLEQEELSAESHQNSELAF